MITGSVFEYKYLVANPSEFPKEIVFATGFDDGDLYNFSRKTEEKVTCLLN